MADRIIEEEPRETVVVHERDHTDGTPARSNTGFIVAAVIIVLILLFMMFGRGLGGGGTPDTNINVPTPAANPTTQD